MKSVLILCLIALVSQTFAIKCSPSKFVTINTANTHGTVHQKFMEVAYAFESLFTETTEFEPEKGAAFAVMRKGCMVVDLWGGNRTDAGDPWLEDTLTITESAAKGLNALELIVLEDMGKFEWDEYVHTTIWPEYAQNGKNTTTMELLASHGGWVLALNQFINSSLTLDYANFDVLLAQTIPLFVPGTVPFRAYHPVSIGWFIDAVIRRLDNKGRNSEEFLIKKVLKKLNYENTEVHYGAGVDLDGRIAQLTNATAQAIINGFGAALCGSSDPIQLYFCRALTNPSDINVDIFTMNDPYKRNVSVPSANVWTTARTLAAVYGTLAHKPTLEDTDVCSTASLNRGVFEVYRGPDLATGTNGSYTRAGFEKPVGSDPFSPNPNAFGRDGLGGQYGVGDRDYKIGMGFLTRSFVFPDTNARSMRMLYSVYDVLNDSSNEFVHDEDTDDMDD